MPIRSVTFYGTPGMNAITDSSLVGVKILGVKREGLGYDHNPVLASLETRQFGYIDAWGSVIFENAFSGTTFGRVNRLYSERVWILYKSLV